jgi:hypothetical protein
MKPQVREPRPRQASKVGIAAWKSALVVAVIDSFAELVDSVLVLVPNPVPTAEQLRQARDLGGEQLRWVGVVARPVRRPVLAGIGAGELLVDRWWAPSAALV